MKNKSAFIILLFILIPMLFRTYSVKSRIYGEITLVEIEKLKEFLDGDMREIRKKIGYGDLAIINLCVEKEYNSFAVIQNENNNNSILKIININGEVIFEKKLEKQENVLLDTGLECGNYGCAIYSVGKMHKYCILERVNRDLGGFR